MKKFVTCLLKIAVGMTIMGALSAIVCIAIGAMFYGLGSVIDQTPLTNYYYPEFGMYIKFLVGWVTFMIVLLVGFFALLSYGVGETLLESFQRKQNK